MDVTLPTDLSVKDAMQHLNNVIKGNGMDDTVVCTDCGHDRPAKHFFDEPFCIYCMIDRAEKRVTELQGKLNFTPPDGGALKRNCRRCKEFVWWVNLGESGRCAPCDDEVEKIDAIPPKDERDKEKYNIDIDDVLGDMMANLTAEDL